MDVVGCRKPRMHAPIHMLAGAEDTVVSDSVGGRVLAFFSRGV
jgi:hypothetical protein